MAYFSRRFALLKNRYFLIYIIGCLFATIGNGLGYIATSWIVVDRYSHGVTAMAILMACFWAPTIVLGPFMGALADKLSRKWLIAFSNFARALIFICFSFFLHQHFDVLFIYIMMLCTGIAFSLFFSTSSAFFRELVAPAELMYANALIDMVYEAGNLIGMGFAGLLIAWTSTQTAVLLNGLAFLIATITLFFIPKKALIHGNFSQKTALRLFADMKAGLSYLRAQKQLIAIYTIQLLIFLTFLTTPLLLVPFSKHILHATVEEFGLIEAFASIGVVIGGVFMPFFAETFGLYKTIAFFIGVLIFVFLLFGFNRSIPISIVFYFMIGFSGSMWALIITKAQSLTDIDFQGRVQSTFNSVSGLMMMLFYVFMGMMGQAVGSNYLYSFEVVITLVALVFLLRNKKAFVTHSLSH